MEIVFKNEEFMSILQNLNLNKNVNKDNICAICRDPLLIDTIELSCGHVYHSLCLQDSFIKYEQKKCPLCREPIFWESLKTKCIIKKKNGDICNKNCYNDEKMCSLHIKTHLRALEKKKTISIKKINQKKKELNKLKAKIIEIENEIKVLESH